MTMSRFEIKGGDILDALRAAGFDAEVHQTGGGTATIHAVKDGLTVLGGPGSYDWAERRNSLFHTGDFWVGPDDDGEDPDASTAAVAGCTAADIVALFVKALGGQTMKTGTK